MKDSVLVIKTGEILEIVSISVVMDIEINITGLDPILEKQIIKDFNIELPSSHWSHENTDNRKSRYLLSDGNTYVSDEIIIGTENIRDWKLKIFNFLPILNLPTYLLYFLSL